MRRALIIQDEEVLRDLLRRSLEPLRLEVVAVRSAAAALLELGARRPDVIVADARMQGMPALALVANLRPHAADVPILMLRGLGPVPAMPAELGPVELAPPLADGPAVALAVTRILAGHVAQARTDGARTGFRCTLARGGDGWLKLMPLLEAMLEDSGGVPRPSYDVFAYALRTLVRHAVGRAEERTVVRVSGEVTARELVCELAAAPDGQELFRKVPGLDLVRAELERFELSAAADSVTFAARRLSLGDVA